MKQLTKKQAEAFYKSKVWQNWDAWHIAAFQLEQERLCMPFEVFHKSLTEALGRDVYTHEMGLNHDGLRREFYGQKQPPTLDEIINLIPEEKRIVILH